MIEKKGRRKVVKNPIAKDLRTPTFRKRVVQSKKAYSRKRAHREKTSPDGLT